MAKCTLHNLLTSCQHCQVFWIYRMNDWDQNILLAKGTKAKMFSDEQMRPELIDHINDTVEYWTIREDGAMFVRLIMEDRAEDQYQDIYVKRWDRWNPASRPYLMSAEMDDFSHTIHGSSDYMHPYGDPLEVRHHKEGQEE